ncbi:MAG: hypothetical protein R2697_19980 [Ilumatobacteraceae bacterium]
MPPLLQVQDRLCSVGLCAFEGSLGVDEFGLEAVDLIETFEDLVNVAAALERRSLRCAQRSPHRIGVDLANGERHRVVAVGDEWRDFRDPHCQASRACKLGQFNDGAVKGRVVPGSSAGSASQCALGTVPTRLFSGQLVPGFLDTARAW